jgi:hypothetical protein
VVDVAANCNAVEIEVELQDLDGMGGSTRVLAAASDGPDEAGWWLLVSASVEGDGKALELWHLHDGAIDHTVALGLPTDWASDLELRPGPSSGEAWLLRRSPGIFQLWQVDARFDSPLVGLTSDLAGFPYTADPCEDEDGWLAPCPTADWYRDLVFLGERGAPFVVSVAPSASTPHTRVFVAELVPIGGNTLWLGQERSMVLLSQCAPPVPLEQEERCEEYFLAVSYPHIDVLAQQRDARPPFAHLLLLRQSAEYGELTDWGDVIVVTLDLPGEDPRGTIQRPILEGYVPTQQHPAGLAIDEQAIYFLVAGFWGHDHLLARMSTSGASVEIASGVPLEPETSLLQLDGDVALSRIVEGMWEVTKLFPDDPRRSQITEYRAPTPISDVQWAGPGAFVVHRADGGPDLLHVRCKRP